MNEGVASGKIYERCVLGMLSDDPKLIQMQISRDCKYVILCHKSTKNFSKYCVVISASPSIYRLMSRSYCWWPLPSIITTRICSLIFVSKVMHSLRCIFYFCTIEWFETRKCYLLSNSICCWWNQIVYQSDNKKKGNK